jgi:hypothetical protein
MTQPVKWEIGPREATYQILPTNECDRQALASAGKLTFKAISVGLPERGPQVAIIPLDESSVENARMIAALPELLAAAKEAHAVMVGNNDPFNLELWLSAVTDLGAAIEKAEEI